MANEFKVRKGLIVQGSGSNIFDVQGSQGQLFSITDSLVGSLFSVNDISGIPIMEVFSDNTIKMGTFNQEAIIVSGSRTGMGIATPQAKLHISGANNDSLFRIQSPSVASIMFVSGSGNVGIGTATPTSLLQVAGRVTSTELYVTNGDAIYTTNGSVGIGTSGPTSTNRLQVRGSGATSATTALRVENSAATARLTILDDGTSAFNTNHLYVSSSGRVGVGTTTPGVTLDVVGQIRASSTMFNSTTQTNTIQLSSATNLQFLSASVETARYDNTGWGFFNTAPTAKVHISGANTDNLFRVSSPTNANILFVTGSGRVGIKTTTPLYDLAVAGNISIQSAGFLDFGNGNTRIVDLGVVSGQGYPLTFQTFGPIGTGTSNNIVEKMRLTGSGSLGLGTTTPSARFHISGGFTDGNLMRVQSSTGAEYFFISASGNVGIGTGTPTNTFQVVGGITATSITASIISASSGITGSLFGTSSWAVSASQALTASFLNGAFLQNGNSFGTTAILGTNDNQNLQFETSGSVRMTISSSGNIGIGTNLPSAILHISGASADSLLRVGSPTNSDILFVNGNGRVGINTTSSAGFLGGNISTFTIFQNSGSGDGLTPATGLQIVNSGSSTSAQAQLSIVTVGDKFAAFNIGTSGSGTQNNYWHLSKRNAAASHALNLYNNNNGTFSSNPLFSFIAGGTSTLGENFQIYIDDANDRVGLQTPPTDTIHLSTDVGGGSYIRIDATSAQAPPVNLASAKSGYGITTNSYFLAEPDYWMEIKLDGTVVLIPCYLPA